MPLTLDLRDDEAEAVRDRVADTLAETEEGDRIEIVADRNVEPALLAHQIEAEVELARDYESTGPEVWELTVTHEGPVAAEEHPAFDARHLPPQQRHSTLTAAFDDLAVGEGFRLLNDHDPKPLYHELNSTRGDVVGWEYREEGGSEWIVEIAKTGDAAAGDDDVVTRFDVREIPKRERHPTIHHRYGMLPEGGTMELIAPHVPRPLQREFRQRYGEGFAWEIVEEEPGRCTVQITKRAAVEAADDGQGSTEDADAGAGQAAASCGHHAEHAHGHGADGSEVPEAETGTDATDESDETDLDLTVTEELDVRDRPPAQRHQAIFEAYAGLEGGEGFVLVNDHDPKPLYHQFDAEAGPEFRWEYQQQAPGEFRVLVGKAADADETATAAEDGAEAPF